MVTSKQNNIFVTKRDGSKEILNLEKIHRVVFWACQDLSGVSQSEIELRAKLQIDEGTKTSDIHEMLIKSASELISEDTPNYQFVAARLINYQLRKEVYGRYEPWTIKQLVQQNIDYGYYTTELLENFDDDDWKKLEKIVKHQRDDLFAFAGMEQWRGKYLVKNRVTGQILETPQMALILISAIGFMSYPKDTRMTWIKEFYDSVSTFDISLPTPVMGGLRTKTKQFSSCVLIESDDSLNSINATTASIVNYISKKAGIGINAGRIRAVGSSIRGGEVEHTGLIPFLRLFQSAVKSASQGGIRGGSATVYFPVWHYEFEELVVLKNNKGTEFNRVRQVDYAFQFNKLMYQRLLDEKNITLFSPSDVPGLLDAFYSDQDEFERLYIKYENDKNIRKKVISATDLFSQFITERKETGRVYLQNIDHCNTHSSFDEKIAPISMSNLCTEITLPVKSLNSLEDPEGRISLCTLAAVNWGKVKTPNDFERPCTLIVRFLDNILTYQDYPVKAGELATKEYRPLGVGIVNLAYFLAKNNLKFDENALELVDQFAEGWSYYLIKASVDLAKEIGACTLNQNTKYSKGILPIDTRKKEIDDLIPYIERFPWQAIRDDLKTYGIRNSTLFCGMPAECQSKDNKMLLADGSIKALGELLIEAGVDVDYYEQNELIGERINIKPINLPNSVATQAYYNGPKEVYEVNIDGDSYKFTGNHLLLVKTSMGEEFIRVDQLEEGMEIVSVN